MPGPGDLPSIDGSPKTPAAGQDDALRHRGYLLPDGHPSSPTNEDGSPRSAPAELKQVESAEETDTPGPGRADAAAYDGASAEWRAQLPRLQGLWAGHKERWPAEQRAPVDRSADEEGSWRGGAPGQYLNAEENIETEHALDRVSGTEHELTETLQGIEGELPGTRLVGLEHRLKGMERFKEKVATELRAKPERSITEITGRMADSLRYTYQCDENSYAGAYRNICTQLEARGSELIVCRNYWNDTDYKGVNTRWLSTNGQIFEVQFHTADSFQAKQLTHSAYERLRAAAPTSAERPELESFQRTVTSHVRVPLDVEAITNYRKDGY
jgi:hypothetical protein